MSGNLSELTQLEKANQNYLTGLELLQTSCVNCRFNPDYLDAIPYFKKAADIFHGCGKFEKEINSREKLVKCFNNEKSFWEEGNEYEKICKTQLNQLKLVTEAHNSIINSFHAYASNHSYDKYYHVLTLNNEDSHHYIYECIDKYIDLLFSKEEYEKAAEVSQKSWQIIKKDKQDEKRYICKYHGFQAIAEICGKKEDKYSITLEKGMDFEVDGDDFCSKINRLVNIVKQNHKDNEKLIKSLFNDISRKVPASLAKMLNIKFIIEGEDSSDITEIKIDSSENEDLK